MYLYHYYAIKKLTSNSILNMDGLIQRKTPLSGDWDEYQKLKDDIESVNGEEVTGKLTLCSLTLLSIGEKEVTAQIKKIAESVNEER